MIYKKRTFASIKKAILMLLMVLVIAPIAAFGARIDVSNMAYEGNDIVVRATVVSDSTGPVKAFGFGLAYACDRMEFLGIDKTGLSGMLQAENDGCLVRVGFMANPASKDKVVTVPLRFKPTGKGPYLASVARDGLNGVDFPKKPGILGEVKAPVVWSVAGKKATLFMAVPDVSKIQSASIQYNGADVLGPIFTGSSWHYDLLNDLFYLAFPDIELPAGVYNLGVKIAYNDGGAEVIDVPVTITE